MKTMNCLLAGLPDTGKSTYIGGLWYNLKNLSEKMVMKASRDLVDDTQRLEILSDKWVDGIKVDRTTEDQSSSVELRIEQKDNGNVLTINIPDFSGETFRQIIEMTDSKDLDSWCEEADTLFYMANKLAPGHFEDDADISGIAEDGEEKNDEVSSFNPQKMSGSAQNIMVLKYLFERKCFKKVIFAISCWDKVTENGKHPENPDVWLKNQSPALYNFLKNYHPNSTIVGVSAQGFDYEEVENNDIIADKTMYGERAFVEIGDDIIYDLSLPLYMLINE